MADVFEYTGANPPGLDILSRHEVVLWKHPQHGWLRAGRNGAFTPVSESEVLRMQGPKPTPAPAAAGVLGATGAGTTNMRRASSPQELTAERKRVGAEGSHQATMDKAKFMAPEREDPLAGLGLMERSELARLIRAGATQEQALAEIKRKRQPPAATQAQGLQR